MKHSIFLFLVVLASRMPAVAQLKPFGLGPYFEKAWLQGSSSENWNDAWGLGLSADLKLPGRLGVTGSAGYFMASGKTVEGRRQPSLKAWPIRAGIKYRLFPAVYLKAEGGYASVNGHSRGSAIFSPGIGVRLLNIDIQAKMEQWWGAADLRSWGLRLALQF